MLNPFCHSCLIIIFCLNLHLFFTLFSFILSWLILESRGETGRDRERNVSVRNIDQSPVTGTPDGDRTPSPSMCPDQESNLPPFGLQDDATTTEPHLPGLNLHQYFRVAFIFMTSRISSSVSAIVFSVGYVLYWLGCLQFCLHFWYGCLFSTSFLSSDPPCLIFSYYLAISSPSSYIFLLNSFSGEVGKVRFFICRPLPPVGFSLLLCAMKYVVTIFFYFVKTFFW